VCLVQVLTPTFEVLGWMMLWKRAMCHRAWWDRWKRDVQRVSSLRWSRWAISLVQPLLLCLLIRQAFIALSFNNLISKKYLMEYSTYIFSNVIHILLNRHFFLAVWYINCLVLKGASAVYLHILSVLCLLTRKERLLAELSW